MKRVWIVEDDFLPSFPSSWYQSWGVSRDERSGRWTLYDRRDGREDEGGVGTMTWASNDIIATAQALVDQSGYTSNELREHIRPLLDSSHESLRLLHDALGQIHSD